MKRLPSSFAFSLSLGLSLGLSMVLAVPAASAAPTRAAVEHLLAGFEPTSAAARFRELGPGTDRVLAEIASDPASSGVRRVRALYALGFVPTDAGRALLRARVRRLRDAKKGQAVLELAACAESLGAFGPTSRADLLPLLTHPSDDVRMGAAIGLARSGAADAASLLRHRLAVEKDRGVRLVLSAAVGELSRK